MDDFELFIASGTQPAVDPERLQMLAKRAAADYIKNAVPLNDSIKELSKEASLNSEQTRRVIEMANTETFVRMFSGGYDKNVDFNVADPEAILSGEKVASRSTRPYRAFSERYVPGQEYVRLDDVFASDSEVEKCANEEWSADRTQAYLDLRSIVKNASAELDATVENCEMALVGLRTELAMAVNSGASLGDAVLLIKEAGVPQEILERVTADIDTAFTPPPTQELTKVANVEHPLYKAASDLVGNMKRFYGTLDMVTGVIDKTEPMELPGWNSLIKDSLGRYVEVD